MRELTITLELKTLPLRGTEAHASKEEVAETRRANAELISVFDKRESVRLVSVTEAPSLDPED